MDDKDPNEEQTEQLNNGISNISLYNGSITSIQDIDNEIHNDIETNEMLLDLHCGEISKGIGSLTQSNGNVLPLLNGAIANSNRSNIKNISAQSSDDGLPSLNMHQSNIPRFMTSNKPIKRTPIDSRTKSDLLAVLKSIDSTNY